MVLEVVVAVEVLVVLVVLVALVALVEYFYSVYWEFHQVITLTCLCGSIAIISPRRQLKTKEERAEMDESAHEVTFYDTDLTNFYKQASPIVSFYNSRDNYAPSCALKPEEYNMWKPFLGKHYLTCVMDVLKDVDKVPLNTQQRNVCAALITDINSIFTGLQASEAVEAVTLAKTMERGSRGPIRPDPGSVPSGLPHSSSTETRRKSMQKSINATFVVRYTLNLMISDIILGTIILKRKMQKKNQNVQHVAKYFPQRQI